MMNTTNKGRTVDVVRASTLLLIKATQEDLREISGTATTPQPDRYGDIVVSTGVKFATPLPLLWQHDAGKAIGSVVLGAATTRGVAFKAVIAKIEQPGPLKTLCDDAWASVKSGLIRSVSIGFRPLKSDAIQGGGVRYLEWEWLELSLVTIPANSEATIADARALTPAEAEVERICREARLRHAADVAAGRWKPTRVVKLK